MNFYIVVAGCRDYCNYEQAKEFIDLCLKEINSHIQPIFLSGGCRGTDALGERYAQEKGYPIERYPAEWKRYGKAAGPKRNEAMAKKCDLLICFWDGKSKGTASMITLAQREKKPLKIKSIPPVLS